jgi:hypothetical protein
MRSFEAAQFDKFKTAMFEAIAFTDLENPDSEVYGAELSEESVDKMESDAKKFWARCRHLIEPLAIEQAGHDFWLTRNGHGVGFWDRPDGFYFGYQEFFTKQSEAMGKVDLYLGDDEKAHTYPY